MPNSKSIVNSQLSNSQFPLRHRIIPTTSPWVATQYAFYAQPAAFEDTMFQYGLHHVLAARGCEPTRRRRQRRDAIPVEIHRQQKHLSYNRLDRHSFALNSLASANVGRAQKLFMLSSYPIPHSLHAPRPSAWLSLSRCMVARFCLYS